MREIKFRAWDIDRKEMYYIDDFYWFEEEGVHDSDGDGHHANYELTQFTGLCDKNDKGIYEGDIIMGNSYGEYPLIIKWDDEYSGFYCHDPRGDWEDHLNMKEATEGKVVGNIYENHELLERSR